MYTGKETVESGSVAMRGTGDELKAANLCERLRLIPLIGLIVPRNL